MAFPVLGAWEARQRRVASTASTLAAASLVGFALVAWFLRLGGASTFLTAVLGLLALLLVFQLLVVVTGVRQQALAPPEAAWTPEAEAPAPAGPPAYAPPPPAAPAPEGEPITLKCSSCGTIFDVHDRGERPLRHTCPGCGAHGELTEADLGPASAAEGASGLLPQAPLPAAAAPAPAAEPITLKCSNCGTIFDVQDTGERPLRHTCPGCGSEGILREEDLGPAPAPAAAPAAPAPRAMPQPAAASQAPAKGPAKTVRTLKLRCKSCSTVFTLRDRGERPLYHECPGCKATGVLR